MRQVCGDKELRKRLREEFPGFELEMLAAEVAEILMYHQSQQRLELNSWDSILQSHQLNRKRFLQLVIRVVLSHCKHKHLEKGCFYYKTPCQPMG